MSRFDSLRDEATGRQARNARVAQKSEGFPLKSLFPHDPFTGFGPARLHPPGFAPGLAQIDGPRAKQLRSQVQASAPRLPGVYGMIDRRGLLIYVGKAKSLRARLMSYFRVKSRDRKAGRIIRRAQKIIWETAPDEFSALIRELELIRRFRPGLNVLGQPHYRRYIYLCLGRSSAPYAFVTRHPTGNELAIHGPLVSPIRAREAARRLNDIYQLRDCPQQQKMHFKGEPDLIEIERSPGCIRFEIGACLGPCAGLCSRKGYAQKVREARDFLAGKDRTILHALEKEMAVASERMHYERAIALRDKLAELRWLSDRLGWLRQARAEHSYVYPLAGPDGCAVWYLIDCGQVRAAVYPPTNAASRKVVLRLIDQVYMPGKESGMLTPHGQVDSVLLVAAWFRKRPEERAQCLAWRQAREQCV